jgi:hypothetical protein
MGDAPHHWKWLWWWTLGAAQPLPPGHGWSRVALLLLEEVHVANPSGFDRDFGYLMPFLDKVAAAANELPDPSARDELTRLVADEKVRWQRIQDLLRGASDGKAPAQAGSLAASKQTLARSSGDGINRVAPQMTGLTVGSLKNSR